uniref:Thioredoxin domain-containing protein n=1 Tax=Pyrodinium bahamense TaxID=73915 RepID=A0A7S0FUC8_9DINO|mmetsp:Transcript_46474/g.129284  ORF Transcript_46474/g.129284 Transcript_46474/m.129284 type:complete len:186 (+) Transcript_46474:79-636(+)
MSSNGSVVPPKGKLGRRGTDPNAMKLGQQRSKTEGEEVVQVHDGGGCLQMKNGVMLIKSQEAWERLLSEKRPMLVMFTSKWCGVCHMMKGLYYNMRSYAPKNFILAVVDLEETDKAVCTSTLGQIAFVPAFQVYVDGDRADYFIANTETTLREKIDKVRLRVEQRERSAQRWHGCFSAFRRHVFL